MNKKKKIVIGVIVISVFIIFGVVGWINQKAAEKAGGFSKNAIAAQVDQVKEEEMISTVKAKGSVEIKTKEALYVKTASTIADVLVEVGDKVEPEQNLIEYDLKTKEDLEQQLKQAKIQLEVQELNLKNLNLPATDTEITRTKSNLKQSEQGIQEAESGLKQAEINAAQSKRAVDEARKQYENNKKLFEQGALSKLELDQSYEQVLSLEEKYTLGMMQIKSAEGAIENAKQQKEIAEKTLQDLLNKGSNAAHQTQVQTQQKQIELQRLQVEHLEKQVAEYVQYTKSPIKGTVLHIQGEKGTMVNTGMPVIEVGDMGQLYIKVDINEFDAIELQEGQEATITSDGLNQVSYQGVVNKIAPIATTKQVGTGVESVVEVEITFDSGATALKPGYSVEVEIVTKHQENATVVPILALLKERNGKSIVYVVKDDYSVERREVQVGTYGDLSVEVMGVEIGEKVIINPNTQIKEGVYIRPLESKHSGDSL